LLNLVGHRGGLTTPPEERCHGPEKALVERSHRDRISRQASSRQVKIRSVQVAQGSQGLFIGGQALGHVPHERIGRQNNGRPCRARLAPQVVEDRFERGHSSQSLACRASVRQQLRRETHVSFLR
jgi:hypothetical protein